MRSLLKITLALLFTFALFSCTNDDDNPKKPKKKYLYKDFKEVTEHHNQGLDYIYNAMSDIKSTNKNLDKTVVNSEFIVNKTIEYLKKKEIKKIPDRAKLIHELDKKYPNLTFDKKRNEKFLEEALTNYKPTQVKYVKEILATEANDVEEFQQKIKSLMDKLERDSSINHKQKEVIYFVAGIAHHSYEYWSKNIQKWKTLLSNNNSSGRSVMAFVGGNVNWNDVWQSDASGALEGLGEGAIEGIITGPMDPVDAIGEGLGEGIGDSAGTGISQWLN